MKNAEQAGPIRYKGPGEHSVRELESLVATHLEKLLNVTVDLQAAERERDAYKKAKAENDERFQLEIVRLSAENQRLREIVGHLPKVPTQPYEKELARQCVGLKRENSSLREEVEALRTAYEIDDVSFYNRANAIAKARGDQP